MQDFIVAICVGLALAYVWRNIVKKMKNKDKCCGCEGCANKGECTKEAKGMPMAKSCSR